MGDLAEVYDHTRVSISEFVSGLSAEELRRVVPATPEWTVKDVVAHLAGDVSRVLEGNFPREFFVAFGDPEGVQALNRWTETMVTERKDRSLPQLLDEWETDAQVLLAMMRGDKEWPEVMPFADRVLLTDLAVHQQDLYGAFGVVRDRESAPIKIATPGYVATVTWRLNGLSPLLFQTEEKAYLAGEGDPGATVTASRFEFFRALSGRRGVDQIKSYDWDGDPEPYIPLFYPYGPRPDALIE